MLSWRARPQNEESGTALLPYGGQSHHPSHPIRTRNPLADPCRAQVLVLEAKKLQALQKDSPTTANALPREGKNRDYIQDNVSSRFCALFRSVPE